MANKLTKEFIEGAIAKSVWDFSNSVLYNLCGQCPDHSKDDVIVAKVMLIGRSYAAAIERRKKIKKGSNGDSFYEEHVAPSIRKSKIDYWFSTLHSAPNRDPRAVLSVHEKLMDLFWKISDMDKRSLASKYLHFHFPEYFYIYDSRSQRAISNLTSGVGKNMPNLGEVDNVYARFFIRCQNLNEEIKNLLGRSLSPRELDKVLLAWSPKSHPR